MHEEGCVGGEILQDSGCDGAELMWFFGKMVGVLASYLAR